MDARNANPGIWNVADTAARASRLARQAFFVLLATPALSLAAVGQGPPAIAPATFASPSGGMPLMRVLLALMLVLAAVFAAAKLSRRMGGYGGATTARLEVVAQASLGPRERAVLLRVGGREVLLGVGTGNVRLLLELPTSPGSEQASAAPTLPEAGATPAEPVPPSFRDLLLRSLGR
jgi:flagellar protein FliO/FliZ